uniref:Myb-like domain-containing protein n=1 Tax=Globisporangium ultimum (strain ATCC 200006 / CBS 805.95 / DAOM BR144) TaxID=431595 RepID=K3WMI4_GLOUD
MALLPDELQAEQRWSSVQDRHAQQWTDAVDEQLVALVTRSTASGERFPVGVNWLEVSSAVGHSPVECVKRYAFLHQYRDVNQLGAVTAGVEVHQSTEQEDDERDQERESNAEEVRSVPFSGLSSGEDIGSPRPQSFSDFSTPLTSPKLSSLDNSDEFGIGIGSPGSPPPFAVRNAKQAGTGAVSSPFRWENLLHEGGYSSPLLKSPPRARHQRAVHLHGPFGVEDEIKSDTSESPRNSSPSALTSPRIVHGTQDHTRSISNPDYAANIINHAFKGLAMEAPPRASSPRMIRTFSNSEYPFLKDDDAKKAAQLARNDSGLAPAFLSSPPASRTPTLASEQQLQAHMMRMSAMSSMSSFHGDNLFSDSLTQSALEDAFLDMAGSRLDASSVLLNSRFSMGQSQLRVDQIQALEKERRQAASKFPR